MEIIHSLENFKYKDENVVICLGNFDGVHLGHQQIIKTMLKEAEANSAKGMVVTFDPHPTHVLPYSKPKKIITSLRHKMYLLQQLGVHISFFVKFDKDFSEMAAEEFFYKILLKSLNINTIVIGYNFHFGKNQAGDADFLRKICKKNNINFIVVDPVVLNNQAVSSSHIRDLIFQARFDEVSSLLGRDYSIFGKVEPGVGRGESLGFPTANIGMRGRSTPDCGVYAVKVRFNEKIYNAAANIGYFTKNNKKDIWLEVFIFDFNYNLYGKEIEVFFIKRIREERVFASDKELKEQIAGDCEEVKTIKN